MIDQHLAARRDHLAAKAHGCGASEKSHVVTEALAGIGKQPSNVEIQVGLPSPDLGRPGPSERSDGCHPAGERQSSIRLRADPDELADLHRLS